MRSRVVALMLVAALSMSVAQYSAAAQWFSDYFMRRDLHDYTISAEPQTSADKQAALAAAMEYNEALAQHTAPLSDESMDTAYQSLLADGHKAIMATISIPKIDVILPVMHGTADEVLALGAGHYYGSSLPVGGPNTHTAITAHSGLVTKEYFTHLPDLILGDEFIINSVAGDLHYKVIEMTQVKANEERDLLDFEPGRDLATLITCVPIGINTHRLLVTGERVASGGDADQVLSFWRYPGFPWWAVWILSAILFAWIVGRWILMPYWESQDAKARKVARNRSLMFLLLAGLLPGWLSQMPVVDPSPTYELVINKHVPPNSPPPRGARYSLELIEGYDFNGDGSISDNEKFHLTENEGWQNATRIEIADVLAPAVLIDKHWAKDGVTDDSGKAVVPGLTAGLYLVTETAAAPGYSGSIPFLVTLPMTDPDARNSWLTTVNVYPKNQPIPPTQPPTNPPTNPPTQPPVNPPTGPNYPPTGGPSYSPTPPTVTSPAPDNPELYGTDEQPQLADQSTLFKTGVSLGTLAVALAAISAALVTLRRRRDDSPSRVQK